MKKAAHNAVVLKEDNIMDEQESEETIFVTEDKGIRKSGKLDEADRQILEEAKTAS